MLVFNCESRSTRVKGTAQTMRSHLAPFFFIAVDALLRPPEATAEGAGVGMDGGLASSLSSSSTREPDSDGIGERSAMFSNRLLLLEGVIDKEGVLLPAGPRRGT